MNSLFIYICPPNYERNSSKDLIGENMVKIFVVCNFGYLEIVDILFIV